MKNSILTLLLTGILLLQNACAAQSLSLQPNTNPPAGAAQIAPAIVSQPPANPNPPATIVQPIALPADIASLTAKEILSANNQVVSQIALMYQHFGLFITIIVTLVGGVATLMSYLARKSVNEFIEEWRKKMESIETEMKGSKTRLDAAVENAEGSAKKAGGYAQSLKDSETILAQTLKDVDRLQAAVASLSAQLNAQQPAGSPAAVASAAAAPAGANQPPIESISGDEDAQVAAQLKGKINSGTNEGKTT